MSKSSSSEPSLVDLHLITDALRDAFLKLDPRFLMRNPVMFVTEVVAALVTILFIRDIATHQPALFSGQIAAWLWFTVLFATFAEAIAEGRGKAQAASLRKSRSDMMAKKLNAPDDVKSGFETG